MGGIVSGAPLSFMQSACCCMESQGDNIKNALHIIDRFTTSCYCSTLRQSQLHRGIYKRSSGPCSTRRHDVEMSSRAACSRSVFVLHLFMAFCGQGHTASPVLLQGHESGASGSAISEIPGSLARTLVSAGQPAASRSMPNNATWHS